MNTLQQTASATIESYDISALMTQTRKLAADYRKQTGQALPVTEELARFDAIHLLSLVKQDSRVGIDAVDAPAQDQKESTETPINSDAAEKQDDRKGYENAYLIKGRVIFKAGKARQKLGKLSLTAAWNQLLMVIYDAEYQPTSIYQISRQVIEAQMSELPQDKRGSMTVAKYKAIGRLVWQDMDAQIENN
jgi:hypothetical protein